MNIFRLDNRIYRLLDKVADFLLLNFLWVVSCIPVITIFPATSAMFGVVRSWQKKEEPSTIKMFFTLFKRNFKHGLLLGIVWSLLGLLFTFNIFVSFQMEHSIKMVLLPLLFLMGILYLYTTIFIFPIMANYQVSWTGIIKNSFLLSLSHPFTSILGIFILAFVFISILFIPISFLVLFSFSAYLIYYLCNQSFQKLEKRKSINI